MKSKERILITSALPYVNNVPHMGNIIGCVLSADVFARYHRLAGSEVLYVCGTDEHGTATETKAQEEGLTPRQLCDKYYAVHKEVYAWFNISFDVFGRTSEQNHHRITQEIFKKLHANGYVLERDVQQAYCPKDQKFLADRFVTGECPHCHAKDARGDQCDTCGKLLDPLELINPRCKTCGSTPETRSSKHLFLDLPALAPQLQTWVEKQSKRGAWTQNATTTTKAWLERGLEPRAITRDLNWGVPVPLPGYEKKVFYVWFDAPIGYVSITDQLEGVDWKSWWHASDVQLYQFMAKDNIPFHTILFPAALLGTGEQWTMLHHIDATEYLQSEDGKFSKSRGTGLFGDGAMASGIPTDVYRYYLLINRPETGDTVFAWKDLQDRLNNELLANLGNLVNRTLKFISQYQDNTVHEAVLEELDANFHAWVCDEAAIVATELATCKERDALKRVMLISQKANGYFQEEQPWKTRTESPERCRRALYVLANTIKDLSILIAPFLPNTSTRIREQLALDATFAWNDIGALSVHGTIGTPEALFAKLEDKDIDAIKEKLAANKNASAPVERKPLTIAAGRIVEVYRHPKAERLFVESVDFGTELGGMRTIVSGLVGHAREEDLRGHTFLFVVNLASANLRGVESQGMILAAQSKTPDGTAMVEPVTVAAEPGTILNGAGAAQITIEEFATHALTTVAGIVHLDGTPLSCESKPVTTTKVKDGIVR